ncbi:hypothetical protein JXB12_13435 [candidate division KSB1 bacterium]|nr:hypothetical protein [candidate division KSB1 bacterium]
MASIMLSSRAIPLSGKREAISCDQRVLNGTTRDLLQPLCGNVMAAFCLAFH